LAPLMDRIATGGCVASMSGAASPATPAPIGRITTSGVRVRAASARTFWLDEPTSPQTSTTSPFAATTTARL
jgi:hypothetical protein